MNLEDIKATLQDSGVAGALGSIISAILSPAETWKGRFVIFFAGGLFSFYLLGPALVRAGVTTPPGIALCSFMVGLIGYNILVKTLLYARETSLPDLFTNLLNVFRGTPK